MGRNSVLTLSETGDEGVKVYVRRLLRRTCGSGEGSKTPSPSQNGPRNSPDVSYWTWDLLPRGLSRQSQPTVGPVSGTHSLRSSDSWGTGKYHQ